MSFITRYINLPDLIEHYKIQGIIGIDRYINKPNAILIENQNSTASKMCIKLIDLIRAGKFKQAEAKLNSYVLEEEILKKRMIALLNEQNIDPENLAIKELIKETELNLAVYLKK
jgi:hypothetical protein